MYERIRNLRQDAELSQEDIAEILFVNRRTYSAYETGDVSMSPEFLIQLSEFHKTSVDYLLGLTDERRPYPRKKR